MAQKGLSVVIPVYNEEKDLPKNIPILNSFLTKEAALYDWEIVIADNASVDNTPEVARKLTENPRIKYFRLEQKGRGRALKKVWNASNREILAYMDVDLSSDLAFFPKLIEVINQGADIAIGSRLAKGAKVYGRPFIREVMSRGYSLLFRSLFQTKFQDAQCGFKVITKEAWKKLNPLIKDTKWFFDTELLIIAQKTGLKITEVPIIWWDDPASTVKVAKTAWGDIKGLIRLLRTKPWKKLK